MKQPTELIDILKATAGKDSKIIQLTDAEYRASTGLSQSAVKDFLKSPAHYLEAINNKSDPTDAMQFGTAFHAEMLQDDPKFFYAVKQKVDGRTKDGKAYNEQFAELNAGKAVINTDDEIKIQGMKDAILRHPLAGALTRSLTHKEVSVFGTAVTAEGYDVRLKGLIDGYIEDEGYIVDYKSCEDASPQGFKKAIREYGYAIQDVQYSWLLDNAGKKVKRFFFICAEKKPPYAVGVYWIKAESLCRMFGIWQSAINRFSICEADNTYPAYSDSAVEIDLD